MVTLPHTACAGRTSSEMTGAICGATATRGSAQPEREEVDETKFLFSLVRPGSGACARQFCMVRWTAQLSVGS